MKHDKVYLRHILDEIEFIQKALANLTYDSFVESEIYTRAFSRSIEIIGEAVKNLSRNFRNENSDIDWKKISGMRDKVIHQYFSVDYDLIWDAVKNKLPSIEKRIKEILD
ncbi:MAG: DUF86 domain-containing protein [Ignavibacteriales bacterium]|nr:DUF86 domain-containing protein [Ignavibacteriales bacterium]